MDFVIDSGTTFLWAFYFEGINVSLMHVSFALRPWVPGQYCGTCCHSVGGFVHADIPAGTRNGRVPEDANDRCIILANDIIIN